MPNECINEMTISGDEKKIKKIIEMIKEKGMNEAFVPIGADANVDERTSAWGQKWEVNWLIEGVEDNGYGIEVESYSGYQLKMRYATAWGPNVPVADAIFEWGGDDLDVELLYWEPNCDFCGKYYNGYEEDGEISIENWNRFFGEIPRWKYIEIGIKNNLCSAKDRDGNECLIGLKLDKNEVFSFGADVIEVEKFEGKFYLSEDQCYEIGLM